jgi:hypothetical protein
MNTRIIIWVGHVACMGERRDVYRVLMRKLDGKRPLGRPKHTWKYNIKMIVRKSGVGAWTGRLRIGTDGGHL